MRTLSVFAVLALGLVGLVAIVGITLVQVHAEAVPIADEGEAQGVDDSLGAYPCWKVRCGTVDGGTSTDMRLSVDAGTGATPVNITDVAVQNTSTTCVRVGGDTTVNTTHGMQVGDSCAAGKVWPVHSKVARCRSEGAAVVVDVCGGRP